MQFKPSLDEKSITSHVFVKGLEDTDLPKNDFFPSNEKELDCYHEFLRDVVDKALCPIKNYILQYDEKTARRDGKDPDIISVLLSLEYAARQRIEKFLDETDKHIGRIALRKITLNNKGMTVYDPP